MRAKTPPRNRPEALELGTDKPLADGRPAPAEADFVVLGKVGRPHGLKGAFFVSGRNDPIPKTYRQVLIGSSPQTAKTATITTSSWQAQRPLLVCSLSNDRTEAEALTNLWIYAPRGTVKAAQPKEILWNELDGAEVRDSENQLLGHVVDLYNAGATDVLSVRDEKQRTVDIAVIDAYVGAEMKFETSAAGVRTLRLVVPASTFAEVWDDA